MDDPIITDPLYWKYQDMVESLYRTLKQAPRLYYNDTFFHHTLAHFAKKIYMMGFEDAMRDYEPSMPLNEEKVIKNKKKGRLN